MHQAFREPTGNRILDGLPAKELETVSARAQRVPIRPPDVLVEPGDDPRLVYFPVEGVMSLVMPLIDGSAVEVAAIGCEGIAGVPAVFGGRSARTRLLGQVRGEALAVAAAPFASLALDGLPVLRTLVLRYTSAVFGQVAQVAACNRLHDNDERLARWLLVAADRVRGDEFDITQEFLGQMLGVRRETVTLSARTLQAAGMIRYHRGQMSIVDRQRLEDTACECYRELSQDTEAVFSG